MRNALEKLKGKFIKVNATVVKYSWENQDFGQGLKTLLLCHVRDSKRHYLTSHTWVRASTRFTEANLSQGDIIEFSAQVVWYATPKKTDYGFSTIRNVRKLFDRRAAQVSMSF